MSKANSVLGLFFASSIMIPLTPPKLIDDQVKISRAGQYQIRFVVKKSDVENVEILARLRGETSTTGSISEKIHPGARYLFVEMRKSGSEERFSFQTVLVQELAMDFGKEIEFVVGQVSLEKGRYDLRAALLGSLGMELSKPDAKGSIKLVRDSTQGYRGPRDYVYGVKDGAKMKLRDERWAAIDEKIRNGVSLSEPLGLGSFESDRVSQYARESRRKEEAGLNLLYNQYFILADNKSFSKDGTAAATVVQKQMITFIKNVRAEAAQGTLSMSDIRDRFVERSGFDPSYTTRELDGSWGYANNVNYYGLSIFISERLSLGARDLLPALIETERLPKKDLRTFKDETTGFEYVGTQPDAWKYFDSAPVARMVPFISDRNIRIYILLRRTGGFVERKGTEPGIGDYEISRLIFVTARPN